jgi:TonB family protein
MKKPILIAASSTLLLFGGILPSPLAETNPAAQQLLVTAIRQANIFRDPAKPLQLDVDFVAQNLVPTQGHLTLKWQATDRWWRKTIMGDFEQIEIRNGDRLYTSRNRAFTPIRVGEVIGLLQFAEGPKGLLAKKQKQRVENGVGLTCLQVERENVKNKPHDFCVDSSTNEILSDEWQLPPDERRREQFTDYFGFGGYRYPRKLQLFINGSNVITAKVDNLTTAAFDEKLLAPPKGAIERRQCDDMKRAVPIKTPDPRYPKSASQNNLMGDTAVAMTVLGDGSVTDIQLLANAGHSMDDATLPTLKSWRFKPAMCGAEPVVSDIEVVVSFRLQ